MGTLKPSFLFPLAPFHLHPPLSPTLFHPHPCQAVDFHRKLLERGGLNLGWIIFSWLLLPSSQLTIYIIIGSQRLILERSQTTITHLQKNRKWTLYSMSTDSCNTSILWSVWLEFWSILVKWWCCARARGDEWFQDWPIARRLAQPTEEISIEALTNHLITNRYLQNESRLLLRWRYSWNLGKLNFFAKLIFRELTLFWYCGSWYSETNSPLESFNTFKLPLSLINTSILVNIKCIFVDM